MDRIDVSEEGEVPSNTCCASDMIQPQEKSFGKFNRLYTFIFHTQKLS
jgi:hypothetical protein